VAAPCGFTDEDIRIPRQLHQFIGPRSISGVCNGQTICFNAVSNSWHRVDHVIRRDDGASVRFAPAD
ncbi:hypothetical protein QP435_07495, partial [Lactobacillus iners]